MREIRPEAVPALGGIQGHTAVFIRARTAVGEDILRRQNGVERRTVRPGGGDKVFRDCRQIFFCRTRCALAYASRSRCQHPTGRGRIAGGLRLCTTTVTRHFFCLPFYLRFESALTTVYERRSK